MADNDIIEPRACNGLLFVGDPHVSSVKPGRRKDRNYAETILKKLEFIVGHANEHDYVVVFLGDMYDTAVEKDEALKTRLLRLLKKLKHLPVGNVGNHDIVNRYLTDGDSLKYLEEAGAIKLAVHSGALDVFTIGDKTVAVGATPYGQDFPPDARLYFQKVDTIIWITHHDIAFEDAYPGAVEPQNIKGCKLAINGHMHLRKPLRRVGETTWFNPGNITRQAVDAIEHIPAVTVIDGTGKLQNVVIPHERSVFDLTGKLIDSISPGEKGALETTDLGVDSAFVAILETETSMEMPKSQDGSILLEDIHAKFERDATDDVVKNIVLDVVRKTVTGEIV